MDTLKLSYFDFNGGRGETARLALTMAGIKFEDHRVVFKDWPAVKAQTPFGAVPVLEVNGSRISQSATINRYVGKLANLYPADPYQAMLCDEVMDAVEEVVSKVSNTMFISDDAVKKEKREAIAAGPMTKYLVRLQECLKERGAEFFADNRLTVADIAVFVWVNGIRSGNIDYMPVDLPEKVAPLLIEHNARVAAHPKIKAYYQGR